MQFPIHADDAVTRQHQRHWVGGVRRGQRAAHGAQDGQCLRQFACTCVFRRRGSHRWPAGRTAGKAAARTVHGQGKTTLPGGEIVAYLQGGFPNTVRGIFHTAFKAFTTQVSNSARLRPHSTATTREVSSLPARVCRWECHRSRKYNPECSCMGASFVSSQ